MIEEQLIYFADQAHVPYGPRPAKEIRRYSEVICRFLLSLGAKLIVVACNTASAAALSYLRATFPETPFVGMEPAVKPGAVQTQKGRIGVLATAGTFGSQRYADLMASYAQGVVAYEDPCPGLVELIEAGRLEDPETEHILREALAPMLAAGVDTLVLGCTHYPFVSPIVCRLAGPTIKVIDPAPAVARQTLRLLRQKDLLSSRADPATMELFTSGDVGQLAGVTRRLLGQSVPVTGVAWDSGEHIDKLG